MLQVILGVIRYTCISDFQKPCASKTTGLRVKDTSRSLCYQFYVVIVFHLVKQRAKPLGFLFNLVQDLTPKGSKLDRGMRNLMPHPLKVPTWALVLDVKVLNWVFNAHLIFAVDSFWETRPGPIARSKSLFEPLITWSCFENNLGLNIDLLFKFWDRLPVHYFCFIHYGNLCRAYS